MLLPGRIGALPRQPSRDSAIWRSPGQHARFSEYARRIAPLCKVILPMARIIQITDLHVLEDPQALLKGVNVRWFLERVVDQLLAQESDCDALVITGDHTHDELESSYSYLRDLFAPWNDRLYQVPGNHDERRILRSVFASRISGRDDDLVQFAFEQSGWFCLGLDTHDSGNVSGLLTQGQIAAARQQADASGAERVAVFCHHPPVQLESEWMDAIGLHGAEHLRSWCESDPRLQLVCCGHVHHESQHTCGHATVLTTPSTGVQFSPLGNVPNFVAGQPGYRVLELTEQGCSTFVMRINDVATPVP